MTVVRLLVGGRLVFDAMPDMSDMPGICDMSILAMPASSMSQMMSAVLLMPSGLGIHPVGNRPRNTIARIAK